MRVLNNRTFTVSNGSKILKWKQITTNPYRVEITCNCFQWFKDTKMKANHNTKVNANTVRFTVSNGSKILKWKQITTPNGINTGAIPTVSNGSKILKWKQITTLCWYVPRFRNCFQWFKDTKMKANHNGLSLRERLRLTVSNGSKILKWKQITTSKFGQSKNSSLFPMVQRY